jgi:hypothetical protein
MSALDSIPILKSALEFADIVPSRHCSAGLQSIPEIFKHNKPNQRGNYRDQKIRAGKYILQRKHKALARPIGRRKLSHQKIRIEEKDNEHDFNHSSPERCKQAMVSLILVHLQMIPTAAQRIIREIYS